ncbi:MAG: fimbrillin family protein [Bacteroidales bacterium]|nr:fimbrillin family protein [Bacteroidales bacterium]
MKKDRYLSTLCLAALLLAGCTKGAAPVGKEISFRAATSQNTTKTAYSGELDENHFERIDWTEGDIIRVLSDKAVKPDGVTLWADYRVTGPTASGRRSVATLANYDPNGLTWAEDEGQYRFWAVYPSPSERSDVALAADRVSAVLPTEQPCLAGGDMKLALLTATAAVTAGSSVSLPFYPAFTAFEFSLKSADDDLVLTSFALYSTSSALVGAYTVDAADGSSVGTVAFEEGANDRISVDLDNFTLTTENELKFTVFALPQELKDLTVLFNTDKGTRRLALKKGDDYLTFAPCKKYRITGLAMPGQVWKMALDLGLEVLEWDDVPMETDFTDNIVAGPFLFDDDTVDLDGKTVRYIGGTMSLNFSVSAPKGGVWRIQKAGNDPDAFVVTVYDEATGTESENLYGAIRPETQIVLHVRPIDALTGHRERAYTMILKTTAELGLRSFSMDSETQEIDADGGEYYTFLLPANE